MECLDDNQVSEFLDGLPSETQSAEVHAHLDECAECRALMADLGSMRASHAERAPESTPPDEIERAPNSGNIVGGRYRLVQEIGAGGMGAVWVAQDQKLRRAVAVKLLKTGGGSTGSSLGRFEREAMAVARLRSAYIVQVHDYGVDGGAPFMVMELLDGQDLHARLEQHGRLEMAAVVRVVAHVANALGTAHEAGIVHRDLKPANVFLVRERDSEIAKVVDFGVAKALHGGLDSTDTTAEGMLIGTPRYMSPEQVHGAKDVDHRTDVWSLGVIAYRCVTGVLPFESRGIGELIKKIANDDPTPPSELVDDLPDGIDAFFETALAKDPADRFQSAADLASALAQVSALELPAGDFQPVDGDRIDSDETGEADTRALGVSDGSLNAATRASPTTSLSWLTLGRGALILATAAVLVAVLWSASHREALPTSATELAPSMASSVAPTVTAASAPSTVPTASAATTSPAVSAVTSASALVPTTTPPSPLTGASAAPEPTSAPSPSTLPNEGAGLFGERW